MLPDVSKKKVINLVAVEELSLREVDGQTLLGRLFDIYLEETPRLIGEVERAVEKRDPKRCYEAMHQMKGSAGAMGALRVYATMERALELCREGKIFEVEDLVERIEVETDRFIQELAAMLTK